MATIGNAPKAVIQIDPATQLTQDVPSDNIADTLTGKTLSSPTVSGNLGFSGTGNRITGDFSNGTVANRLAFQTSTTNGATDIGVIPNGTGTTSTIKHYNSSDPNNASWGRMLASSAEIQLASGISGTGTYLPMTFYTGGAERLRIGTDGNVSMAGTLAMGSAFSFRNKIINGGFDVWQRGTSFAGASAYAYTADRFYNHSIGATNITASRIARPTGYGGTYALRLAATSATNSVQIGQAIESFNLASLKGKVVTFSFWAVSSVTVSATTYIYKNATADTTSGGSWSAVTDGTSARSFTTTPTRFTTTITVPDDGTANGLAIWLYINNMANGATVTTWDFQLEEGSVATPFESRPYGVELALCQRYYYRVVSQVGFGRFGAAFIGSAAGGLATVVFPVSMRINPTALEQSGSASDYAVVHGGTSTVCSAVPSHNTGTNSAQGCVGFTVASGLTTGQGGQFSSANGITTAYLGWSAEL